MKNTTELSSATATLVLMVAVVGVLLLSLLPAIACPPTTNLGPNSSVFSPPPLNPQVQSIHPK